MKIENAFNAKKISVPTNSKGYAGFDNARENIDPHVRTKALSALSLNVGSNGKCTKINTSGALYFETNGSGLFHGLLKSGSTYVHVLLNINQWYQYTGFNTAGNTNGMDADPSQDHIKVIYPGRYFVNVTGNFTSPTTPVVNHVFEFMVKTNNGTTDFDYLAAKISIDKNYYTNFSISGIMDLDPNDTIELWVRRLSSALYTNINFFRTTMTAYMIAGT